LADGGPGRTAGAFAVETKRIIASRTSAELVLVAYCKEDHTTEESQFVEEMVTRIKALEPGQSKDMLQQENEDCIGKGYLSREGSGNRRFLKPSREFVEEETSYLEAIHLSRTKKPVMAATGPNSDQGGEKELPA
jgi:hypothetical protein